MQTRETSERREIWAEMNVIVAEESRVCRSLRLGSERPMMKIWGDVVFLRIILIAERPMPDVAPTKTAVGEREEMELLAARTALIKTILWMVGKLMEGELAAHNRLAGLAFLLFICLYSIESLH